MSTCNASMYTHGITLLTDDDYQDDQDYDDEDDPQLHILPPQLALQTSGCALEHVSILVEVVCSGHTHTCTRTCTHMNTHTHEHVHTHTHTEE